MTCGLGSAGGFVCMHVEGTIPIRRVTLDYGTQSPRLAVAVFLAKFPEARVEQIDGELVRGVCVLCGVPIMRAMIRDKHYAYDDASQQYRCAQCAKGPDEPHHHA